MYSPGDAVAKVDGYIISVKGAGQYVGRKRLVRIDEVGRTAAAASLVGEIEDATDDDGPGESEPNNDDGVESKPRRRGRRGGRRRSGARAETTPAASE
jgi:ribonuclease G